MQLNTNLFSPTGSTLGVCWLSVVTLLVVLHNQDACIESLAVMLIAIWTTMDVRLGLWMFAWVNI